jgi:hypothetical protein
MNKMRKAEIPAFFCMSQRFLVGLGLKYCSMNKMIHVTHSLAYTKYWNRVIYLSDWQIVTENIKAKFHVQEISCLTMSSL